MRLYSRATCACVWLDYTDLFTQVVDLLLYKYYSLFWISIRGFLPSYLMFLLHDHRLHEKQHQVCERALLSVDLHVPIQ